MNTNTNDDRYKLQAQLAQKQKELEVLQDYANAIANLAIYMWEKSGCEGVPRVIEAYRKQYPKYVINPDWIKAGEEIEKGNPNYTQLVIPDSLTKMNTNPITPEQQKIINEINEMSHFAMCSFWRNAPSGHPYFDNSLPYYKVFRARLFDHFGGFTPEISKALS